MSTEAGPPPPPPAIMHADDEDWVWNAETDILLFQAMKGIRPVGVDKHFQMLQILNKWHALVDAKRGSMMKDGTNTQHHHREKVQHVEALYKLRANDLWQRMKVYYDLDGLDELVSSCFVDGRDAERLILGEGK